MQDPARPSPAYLRVTPLSAVSPGESPQIIPGSEIVDDPPERLFRALVFISVVAAIPADAYRPDAVANVLTEHAHSHPQHV
jgi:hypothetical protein